MLNDHFTATKNPHYWRPGVPYHDTMEYRTIPDSNHLLNSLMSDSVDIIHTSTPAVTQSMCSDSALGFIDDI